MSQLRSVLEEIAAVDLDGLTPEDLAGEIGEVAYGIQTLEVFQARLVAQLATQTAITLSGIRLLPTCWLMWLG